MTAEALAYDPQALNQKALVFFAEMERLRDATKRARRKLERAKNADEHIACLLQAKGTLIQECLALEIAPDTLADTILKTASSTSINRRKLIGAIQRCVRPVPINGGTPRKRIGRPPRNTSTATAPPQEVAAKPKKPPATSSADPIDSPEREQRMRRKSPVWASHYSGDRKYAAVVARRENESDADYCWRMWHTAPPWSGDQPRFADQLTETQWIEKCWNLKSPEERAAHEASLPTTAR